MTQVISESRQGGTFPSWRVRGNPDGVLRHGWTKGMENKKWGHRGINPLLTLTPLLKDVLVGKRRTLVKCAQLTGCLAECILFRSDAATYFSPQESLQWWSFFLHVAAYLISAKVTCKMNTGVWAFLKSSPGKKAGLFKLFLCPS